MKKVTVIMAFYNEEPTYVRINIDSILNQTYKDFDFILISDNPNNEILNNMASDYARSDSRIKFIKNKENIGIPKTKNKALSLSKSEYIAISDADDFSHPERIRKEVEYLDTHPDVVAVGAYARIMDKDGEIIGEMHTSDDDKKLKTMLPFRQPLYHPLMMYRRVVDGKPVMYNEKKKISLDYELCVQLSEYKFYNIPEYLLDYRVSPNQTTQVHADKYIEYDSPVRKIALKKFYKGLEDNEIDAFNLMYYKQHMTEEQMSDASKFIINLSRNNKDNEQVYVEMAIDYLILLYFNTLEKNKGGIYTIKEMLYLKYTLDHNPYSGLKYLYEKKYKTKLRNKLSGMKHSLKSIIKR